MKRHLHSFMIGAALAALCIAPAHALEYSFDAPPDYLFGQSTSDSTIYARENPNVDRSKDVALAAPGFGTPTSYLPYSGEYLTPNLVSGASSGGQAGLGVAVGNSGSLPAGNVPAASAVAAGATVEMFSYPTLDAPSGQNIAFTEVMPDFYYPNGSLGTLKIPSIYIGRGGRYKESGVCDVLSFWNWDYLILDVPICWKVVPLRYTDSVVCYSIFLPLVLYAIWGFRKKAKRI